MYRWDGVWSGGGSDGLQAVGAFDVFTKRGHTFDRTAGASVGAIMAAGVAAGFTPERMRTEMVSFLTRGDLEDWCIPGPLPLKVAGFVASCKRQRFGFMKGQALYAALRSVFGDMRMSELERPCRIGVGNMPRRRTMLVCSQLGLITVDAHGKVKQLMPEARHAFVADVVRCSCGVPFLFELWRIMPDRPALYADSGIGVNVPRGAYNDTPRDTVVFSYANSDADRPIVDLRRALEAVIDLARDAANEQPAREVPGRQVLEVSLPGSGAALDFSLLQAECDLRLKLGEDAATKFLDSVEAA